MTVQIQANGNVGDRINLKPVMAPGAQEPSMVLNFSIASAVFKSIKQADGTFKKEAVSTEWLECEYWNRNADHLSRLLKKGMPVFVTGEERIERWTNANNEEQVTRRVRVEAIYIVPNTRIVDISLRPPKARDETTAIPDADIASDEDIPM